MANEQKTPLVRTLPLLARRKAVAEIQKRGQALPGHVVAVSGALVTINFDVSGATLDQVQMPLAGSEYVRLPIKVGDKGYAATASLSLAGVSGLGIGVPSFDTVGGNLSALCWVPLGNKNWTAVAAGYLVMYGPNGVIIQDVATASPTTFVKVTTGEIQLTAGGHTIAISSAGVVIDGIVFAAHTHLPGTYVAGSTAVTGDSGAVV